MKLTSEQQKAVNHNFGPMLILAGAGSGKTTTLVARVSRLIKENVSPPHEICLLTFTNKAAREMKERIEKAVGSSPHNKIWAGTFHSFGLNILRRHYKEMELPKYFGILDQSDSSQIVRELLKTLNISGKKDFDDKKILSMISRSREGHSVLADENYQIVLEWILPKYEKKKKLLGVVDFDDLILKPLEILKSNNDILESERKRISQMMIDEFQDTNMAQMKLIDLLIKDHQNLTVVGDDDQSIYGWRGAHVQNILDFPKKYKNCVVVRLEENYRSSKSIINLANFVIKQNSARHDKVLKPMREVQDLSPEILTFPNEMDEVDGVLREIYTLKSAGFEYKDIAILYRSNTQGAVLESEFKSKNIPYDISGGTSFLERKEVKDALAYLRCALFPNDVSFRRIFNTPARGLGEVTFETIHENAQKRNITFYEQSKMWNQIGISEKTGSIIQSLFSQLLGLKQNLLNLGQRSPGTVFVSELEKIGFKEYIYHISKEPQTAQKRWQWVEILGRILDKSIHTTEPKTKDYDEFLSFMELKDTSTEEDIQGIRLMTLHASKGLEFPVVLIVGVEEDLIPHKTLGTDLSEERKLFYVGITRAQKRLILTHAKQRTVNGAVKLRTPSRFITNLTENLVKIYPEGFRPVSQTERKKLLADLFTKLDQ